MVRNRTAERVSRFAACLPGLVYSTAVIDPAISVHISKPSKPLQETTWGDAEHVVHRLAGELSNKPWLLGDWFTAADIAVGAVLTMAPYSKQLPENDTLRRNMARPAFSAQRNSPGQATSSPAPDEKTAIPENPVKKHRIYTMSVASVYPHYVAKAEKKGRTKEQVDEIVRWLTGYTQKQFEAQLAAQTDFETFFAQAPRLNPSRDLIKGVICGVRVENIEEPTMREIRYLDKLVDELAKGKAMEKILRK